jgi:hypothetical protein
MLHLLHHILLLHVSITKDDPQKSTLKGYFFLLLGMFLRLFVVFHGNKNQKLSYLRPRHNMAANNTEMHV